MAKLKRNTIQLVVDPTAEELKLQTYLTPAFIPFGMVYEAIDLIDELEKVDEEAQKEAETGEISEKSINPREMMDKLVDMTVKIYNNQFTSEELKSRLHAPDALLTLRQQVVFITQGQQTQETKNFIANMK